MVSTSPIFKKFIVRQQHYLKTCNSQCYIKRPINVESTSRYLYRPVTVTETVLDQQVPGNNLYAEFYENPTNNLLI
jgi:hypothetical protein